VTTQEEAMQDRLVRVEVLLHEVLRRLDSDVTPRHTDHEARIRLVENAVTQLDYTDHETRLRLVEVAVTQLKTRVAIVAGGTGTASGILAAVIAHFVGS
jgi:hypothetical protein